MKEIRFTKVLFISTMLLMMVSGFAQAQRTEITGTVQDETTGEALPGVNIVEEGTTNGTITDLEGNFTLQVSDPNAVLKFSFVGYLTESIPLEGRTSLDVSLVQDVMTFDEVVVVGYGTQRKEDLTGAVSVVNTEDFERSSKGNVADALQGQVSGVQVQSSGAPGGNPRVQIRGVGTLENAEPLYVVDGVPIANYVGVNTGEFGGSDGRTGGISDLNPENIESIQILKDASAAAIYGSRGANGVVIITTKRGETGELKVNYSGSYGWESVPKYTWYEMADREQFQEMNNVARENTSGFPAPANNPDSPLFIDSIDTDWQEAVFEPGYVHDHSLSFSGGNEGSKYYASLSYFDQSGTMAGPPPQYKRYSIRLNGDQSKGRFNFGQSILFTHTEQDRLSRTQWASSVHSMLLGLPTVAVYDSNNLGGFGAGDDAVHDQIADNQVALNHLRNLNTKRFRILATAYGEVMIIEGLKYKLNLSYDRSTWLNRQFVPEFELGRQSNPIAFMERWRGENPYMLMENTLTYNKTFGRHNLTVMGGYTAQYDYFEDLYGYAEGFERPYLDVLNAGPDNREALSSRSEHTMISYLGRFNYSYDDRYFATVNYRRDYSSRFGPGNKYGDFPSYAGAWKISSEDFFDVPAINLLKLRGGWGKIGNENIGDYLYAATINQDATYVFGGALSSGGIQVNIPDPGIKWEERITSSVGFDAAFLQNKIELSAEYYRNEANDILYDVPIPLSVGSVEDPTINAASMTNQGIEISATYRKAEGDFHYSISANISTLKNEVTATDRSNTPITTPISRTEVGHSMGELYGYEVVGIFQTQEEIDNAPTQEPGTSPGDIRFADLNGDTAITTDDRKYLGSAFPKLTGGLNFNMDYMGFDFSLFLQGNYGNKIFNGPYQAINSMTLGNYSVESYENYWRGEGTSTEWPRPAQTDPNGNNRVSDRWVQDGSYLRIQNIQLGYTIPDELLGAVPTVTNLRVYVGIQNLYTFTKYKGYSPDVFNDGLLNRGSDDGSYPTPRTIKLGIKMSL